MEWLPELGDVVVRCATGETFRVCDVESLPPDDRTTFHIQGDGATATLHVESFRTGTRGEPPEFRVV